MTDKCIAEYAASGLEGTMGMLMPCMDSVLLDDDTVYVAVEDESEQDILDRIKRSKEVGRNLFLEEWELFEEDPDVVY